MLTKESLWGLEEYSDRREQFRHEVLEYKKVRRIQLGEHLYLMFEDETTIKYQIQEMLRIEKIFDSSGIQDELDAYNPLIPDGDNLKCTMLIQYEDPEERKEWLSKLVGVEDKVWLQIGDNEKVFPIADEDIERTREEKTSSVHFLRYQLSAEQIAALETGAPLRAGVDHHAYCCDDITIQDDVRRSLLGDLKVA